MNIFKKDPEHRYYGVRFELASGRVAERFFETAEDRTWFLEEFDYVGQSFTDPR